MILCRLLFVMLLSLLVSISRSYRNSYSCRYNSNSYSINVGKSHSSRYPYKVIGKQYSSLKLINDNNFWNSVDNDHYINSNSYSYSKRKKTELYNINTVTSFVLTNFNTIKSNEWYLWTILSLTSTIGLYSEKYRIGSLISSPLVSMGLCLLLCNVNIIPNTSIVYNIILKYFIPIAIPLLLLDADLNKCIKATGSLLKAFLLGSVGTIIGTLVAYLLVPMRKLNGADKIAAALCARHVSVLIVLSIVATVNIQLQ